MKSPDDPFTPLELSPEMDIPEAIARTVSHTFTAGMNAQMFYGIAPRDIDMTRMVDTVKQLAQHIAGKLR